MKILLVDDKPSVHKVFNRLLEDYEVYNATTIDQATAFINNEKLDFVLCDWQSEEEGNFGEVIHLALENKISVAIHTSSIRDEGVLHFMKEGVEVINKVDLSERIEKYKKEGFFRKNKES